MKWSTFGILMDYIKLFKIQQKEKIKTWVTSGWAWPFLEITNNNLRGSAEENGCSRTGDRPMFLFVFNKLLSICQIPSRKREATGTRSTFAHTRPTWIYIYTYIYRFCQCYTHSFTKTDTQLPFRGKKEHKDFLPKKGENLTSFHFQDIKTRRHAESLAFPKP